MGTVLFCPFVVMQELPPCTGTILMVLVLNILI